MKYDGDVVILEKGDVYDHSINPNLSGDGFRISRDGDGTDESLVFLQGFGNGDPSRVKAKRGALVRMVPNSDEFMIANGAEPYSAEVKANKASYVSAVNGDGWKVVLGQWPEGAPDAPDSPVEATTQQ